MLSLPRPTAPITCTGGLLLLLAAVPAVAQVPENVLVLTSESTGTPGMGLLMDAAVGTLQSSRGAVNVFVESFQQSTFPGDSEALAGMYRPRYGTRRLDLVITVCPPALVFALRHRQDIFPGVPILYSFLDASMLPPIPASANLSGVLLDPDWDGLVEQVLAFHPRTKHLLVVSGAGDFDRDWRASFDAVAPMFDSRVTRRYASNRSLADLLGEVATADHDTLVLFISFARDATGASYVPRDVFEMVRRVSPVAVYGPSTTYVEAGAVGGSVLDLRAHGADLGRMAVRVLAGERPEHLKPLTTARRLVFDWRELQRFGISTRQLPAGAEVLFQEPSFWTFHPWIIVAAVLVFGGQTALIAAMLAQRRRRANLEHRLTSRLRFETLLSDVSTALGSVAVSRIETALLTSVATMRQYLGVDRLSIFEFTPDGRARRSFEDTIVSDVALPPAYPLTGLPMMALAMTSLQPFVMEKVDDLPEDAHREREAVTAHRIRSLLLVPLEVGGQALGALSCVSHTAELAWPADRVQQVRALGQPLAHALQRRLNDTAVVESDRLRGAVLSSISAQIAVLDRAGTIIAVNDAWLAYGRSHGVRDEASISPGANYLAVCERAAAERSPWAAEAFEGIKAVCRGGAEVYDTEYRLEAPSGEQWFAMKAVPLRHASGGAVVTHRDITAEKRQELALRRSEQRFRLLADAQRVLSGRLITAQEDERRRIARELHDDFQQRLALLAMELDAVAVQRRAMTADEVVECARRLWQQASEVSSDLHALSHRLHPSKLEALGLRKTVEGHCRELSAHGLRIAFSQEDVPDWVPPDVALCAFRVVQESLQNVVKHSGASEARVTMTGGEGRLRIVIEDGGRGFDSTSNHQAGLGLVSMRERVHVAGGALTIESTPGRGTKVAFELPCPEDSGAPFGSPTLRDGREAGGRAAAHEARM